MVGFVSLRVRALGILAVLIAVGLPIDAAGQTFKIAYWNIQSGKGEPALPGHPVTFSDTTNCTDPSQPLSAWGVGFVQQHLTAAIGNDPSVVALGLGEAWPCASPENVRKALGWKAKSSERNGVGIVARHGFAGPEEWIQLDTSLNTNIADTMWVVRVPVCLDSACSTSINVFTAHWYGTGTYKATTFERQAAQTVEFLRRAGGAEPHVLVGDLNVWTAAAKVCSQTPSDYGTGQLRDAGYVDAWPLLHGGAEGFTGMTNRAGCGIPEGYTWKRVDYSWSPAWFLPVSMVRFGMPEPGYEAPSDHYGIIVEFPMMGSGSDSSTPPPPPAPAPVPAPAPAPTPSGEVVLYAKDATIVGSTWRVVSDASAAGGARVSNPDAAAAKLAAASAAPTSYFELSFHAEAGRAYRLWIRGIAERNYWGNDSVYVQFDGSVSQSGAAVFRIGTTDGTWVNLEDAANAGISGWGWQDNGYGAGVLGPAIYFAASGPQTIRVQTREDGFSIDQIVLSPEQYLTASPGALKNDGTIVPQPAASTKEIVLLAAQAAKFSGTWGFVPDVTAAGGIAVGSPDAGAAKVAAALSAPANFVEFTFDAEAGLPYRLWVRGRAERDYWGNDSVFVQFSGAADASGAPIWRIGTTDSVWVNLEDAANAGVSGWGWQDNGYGAGALGPVVTFAASGPQTVRIQTREDGFRIDQIVLSSETYLQAAPGALKNDTTILR